MMRIALTIIVAMITESTVTAQYFQFSQYNFTQQRINPASVASTDYASVGLIYRNQAAAGDVTLKSTMLSAAYPILSARTGQRWSGVGVTLMDDRSAGIFGFQEVSMSYAVNVPVARDQTLSLGFKGLYQQRRLNANGLFTGAQYVPDRGFDQSISDGENLQAMQSRFFTMSAGLYWQQTDKTGRRLAYWGASLFDFNKPEDSFLGVESQLSSTIVLQGGVQVMQQDKLAVTPEFLFTRSSSNNVVNAGFVTSYNLGSPKAPANERLDLITKYIVKRSAVVGLQWHRENISLGVSYDFPLISRNASNFSTVEVAIELRRLVDPKLKKRSQAKRKTRSKNTTAKKPVEKKVPATVQSKQTNARDSVKAKTPVAAKQLSKKETLKTTLQHKQDSVLASANAGTIRHEPLVLETVVLHFNFEFNSSDLDEASEKYLDDLAEALRENEHLRIKLTGHTDNIGSARFNLKLSRYRADAIKGYLVEKGVDGGRIDTDGKGLTQPLVENTTEEGRAKNRRVELEILYN